MRPLRRFVHLPKLLTVASHEHGDLTRRLGNMQQGPIHFLLQVRELREIFQMRRLLFHFLPQVLNGVKVWRIGWQLLNRQAIRMGLEKWLHRFARVIPGPLLDHDPMLLRLRQDIEQKRGIALRVKATRLGVIEKLPGDIVNEAKDFVALTFAAGRHLGLLAFKRPGCVGGPTL